MKCNPNVSQNYFLYTQISFLDASNVNTQKIFSQVLSCAALCALIANDSYRLCIAIIFNQPAVVKNNIYF